MVSEISSAIKFSSFLFSVKIDFAYRVEIKSVRIKKVQEKERVRERGVNKRAIHVKVGFLLIYGASRLGTD